MKELMIEVFKTNVHLPAQAAGLQEALFKQFPMFKINFDLHDCDRILRVEGENISNDKIIQLITASGYQCMVLD